MATYLVERYLPGIDADGLRALVERLRQASARLRADGTDVHYLGSLYLPDEESCFCRLDAPSAEAAARLNELASTPYARISEAVALCPDHI
jgi:Nickel responsive protein SCO4226-like